MKRLCVAIATFIGVISLSPKVSFAWPRLGYGANVVTQNSGDKATCGSVIVSSTSATQVYSSTAKHREILFQNTSSTYTVNCGTFSAVTATVGVPRFILPQFPTGFTTNATMSVYCIAEPGAPSIEVLTEIEFDAKD